jgi:hypothetical protein
LGGSEPSNRMMNARKLAAPTAMQSSASSAHLRLVVDERSRATLASPILRVAGGDRGTRSTRRPPPMFAGGFRGHAVPWSGRPAPGAESALRQGAFELRQQLSVRARRSGTSGPTRASPADPPRTNLVRRQRGFDPTFRPSGLHESACWARNPESGIPTPAGPKICDSRGHGQGEGLARLLPWNALVSTRTPTGRVVGGSVVRSISLTKRLAELERNGRSTEAAASLPLPGAGSPDQWETSSPKTDPLVDRVVHAAGGGYRSAQRDPRPLERSGTNEEHVAWCKPRATGSTMDTLPARRSRGKSRRVPPGRLPTQPSCQGAAAFHLERTPWPGRTTHESE